MEKIIQIVLEKCISIFEEEKSSSKEVDEEKYGKFPERATIELYIIKNKTKSLWVKGDSVEFWEYSSGELSSIACLREEELVRSGMYYYNRASFSFAIEEDKVRLSCVFGPRYGRGLEYDIIYTQERIQLVNEKCIWVS